MNTESDISTVNDSDATESPVDGKEDAVADIRSPEYQEFDEASVSPQSNDLSHIQNIQITVSAELGRTTIPIQDLVQLAEGALLELNREIDSPVDLVAQGVKLATGEVVVVDGCFAVRVLHVHDNN